MSPTYLPDKVQRTSLRESDSLEVGQAISSPLLFMSLKLYGADDLAAHLHAVRTWSGVSAQLGLHKGL